MELLLNTFFLMSQPTIILYFVSRITHQHSHCTGINVSVSGYNQVSHRFCTTDNCNEIVNVNTTHYVKHVTVSAPVMESLLGQVVRSWSYYKVR